MERKLLFIHVIPANAEIFWIIASEQEDPGLRRDDE